MSNDDILCGERGPGDRSCTLPYGHQPSNIHMFEVDMPHDLSEILEGIMTSTEKAKAKYEKMHRRERFMYYAWMAGTAFYLVAAVWQIFT